jgi:hypothetical protein
LQEITDKNINEYRNDYRVKFNHELSPNTNTLKDAEFNCGFSSHESKATNGDNRTVLQLNVEYLSDGRVQVSSLIRPYKKTLGVWYWCTRTLSCDLKLAIDIKDYYGTWNRQSYHASEAGKSDSKLSYVFFLHPITYSDIHFG